MVKSIFNSRLMLLIFSLFSILMNKTAFAATFNQENLNSFAHQLGYRFTIIQNQSGALCPHSEECFTAQLDLKMPSRTIEDQWSIYFSFVEQLKEVNTAIFSLKHINGDLYKLETKAGVRLVAGKTYSVKMRSAGHFFSEYFPMPNAFITMRGLKPETIAASQAVIDTQTGLEQLPFVTPMTDEKHQAVNSLKDITRWSTPERDYMHNAALSVQQSKPDFIIIPQPLEARHLQGPALDFRSGATLELNGIDQTYVSPALAYLQTMGVPRLDRGPKLHIDVAENTKITSESYTITATADLGVHIQAKDVAGVSYALRSLAQQIAYEKGVLQPLNITDTPRFKFRGMFIDVARNFHSKAEILKLIENMGLYKLNRLHLHMGDDEGWRLEIAGLPELTEVGSVRCHNISETRCLLPQLGAGPDGASAINGYFSRLDYIDILHAAEARQIEVIPSFDMPGHSRAAIRSMEARYKRLKMQGRMAAAAEYRLTEPEDKTIYRSVQNYNDNTLNVCLPSTYHFIDKIIDTVFQIHAAAGVPLKHYHIGGDETAGAWIKSPTCQTFTKVHGIATNKLGGYFITRVAKSLVDRGIGAAGWSDGVLQIDAAKIPSHLQSNSWQRLFVEGIPEIHAQINQGLDVVLSTPDALYFDMPYTANQKEPGYDWASRGTDLDKVFSFMPQNLSANAILYTDITNHAVVVKNNNPILPGHDVIGMQAQLFSETVRSDSQVDYMIYPRLQALAERAWHVGAWELPSKPNQSYTLNDGQIDTLAFGRDYQNFKERLAVHLPWLDKAGVKYRVPPVGASIRNGFLLANLPYGALTINYRVNSGAWSTYTTPVRVKGHVELLAKTSNGRPGRSIILDGEAAQ